MFGPKITENPLSKCKDCLVKSMCERMCDEQAEIIVDNAEMFYEDFIVKIVNSHLVKNGKKEAITLVVNSENVFVGLEDVKNNPVSKKI